MIASENRLGRFTSSKVYKLLSTGKGKYGFGDGALTYINQRKAERTLGRSVDTGAYNQTMAWGKVCEAYLCWKKELLGLEYSLVSQSTTIHTKYNFWSGSPDLITDKKISEIKCYYPENFYNYSKVLFTENLTDFRKDFKEEYYQIVSNAIIFNKSRGEAIAFIPTETQLIDLRDLIENKDFLSEIMGIPINKQWQYRFIYEKELYELPYIPDSIEYPNLVKFEFEIPIEDIILLTKAVLNAEKLLNE